MISTRPSSASGALTHVKVVTHASFAAAGILRAVFAYLGLVWQCRWFWLSLARLDLRKRYRRSFLGLGWSLVQPVVTSLTLCGVFGATLGTDFRSFFPFLVCGLCFWSFFAATVDQGCGCLYWSESYIRQHRAPMGIYPLRIVLAAAFHLLTVLVPLTISVWLLRGVGCVAAAGSLLATLVLLVLFGWSMATVCGFLNVYFPDTQQVAGAGLQILFYFTPVIYRPGILDERNLGWVKSINPLAVFLDAVRRPVLDGTPATLESLAVIATAACVAFTLAAVVLARLERRVIFLL